METQYSDELGQPAGGRARSHVVVAGQELDRIAGALAEQFALAYEASPVDARATFAGDILTFAFQGGFTALDEHHLATGRAKEVGEFRERFLRSVSEELNEVVEAMLPVARVDFFFAGFEVETGTTNCFFVLSPVADSERAQREAIMAWGDQVRRSARGLRERTRSAREATRRIARGRLAAPRPESDRG